MRVCAWGGGGAWAPLQEGGSAGVCPGKEARPRRVGGSHEKCERGEGCAYGIARASSTQEKSRGGGGGGERAARTARESSHAQGAHPLAGGAAGCAVAGKGCARMERTVSAACTHCTV